MLSFPVLFLANAILSCAISPLHNANRSPDHIMHAYNTLRSVVLLIIYHCSLGNQPQVATSLGKETVKICLDLAEAIN